MLAKVTPPTNDFHALARYLVHGKPGATYDPKRVAWVFSQNLPTDDADLAAAYMTATAGLSSRTKNAAYHMMIAWHERERPTPELMQQIAMQTLEMAGLAEHQALIMAHGDKPHPHLHILLNRIHPETGRAWKTNHDFARLDHIMRQLASEHGCEYSPAHSFNPDLTDNAPKRPNSRATYAAKRGAKTNRAQWSKATARVVSETLSEDLTHASTVDDVAAAMEENGLQLEAKGKGLVVGTNSSYAKLSSLNLHMSAHGLSLMRSLATTSGKSPVRKRPLFTVDEVDIVRALKTCGLADNDDIRNAVQATKDRRHAAQRLNAKAKQTSTLSPLLGIPQTRPSGFDRGQHRLGR